jgi:hypothetical protein
MAGQGMSADLIWQKTRSDINFLLAERSPLARNTRINATYADIYLADRTLYWPGLAAFSSKQVGCILGYKRTWPVKHILAAGNREVFREMGLLLRFYEQSTMVPLGLAQAEAFLKGLLAPTPDNKFLQASVRIVQKMRIGGNDQYWSAAYRLAEHEQAVTLEEIVYKRLPMRLAIRLNRLAGDLFMPIAIHFVADCSSNDPSKCLRFGARHGILSDTKSRLKFAREAIDKLLQLIQQDPQGIRDSLIAIKRRYIYP